MRWQFKDGKFPPHIILEEEKFYDVKEVSETRTLQQNALIWAVVYPQVQKAFNELGIKYSIEVIHKAFKKICLPPLKRKRNPISWKYDKEEPTTTNLSKKEFTKYIRDIEEYAIEELNYTLDLRDLKELLYWEWQIDYK